MNMEFNKILAAVLVAGIIAYFSGIISHGLLPTSGHKEQIEDGFVITATETPAGEGTTAAPAGPEPIDEYMANADPAHGQKVAKVCAACHSFEKDGPNRVGPHLYGIYGANHAAVEGFAYSEALKSKPGKWDVAGLNEFLWSPKAYAPGTKMSFAGIKKPEDRAAVIKWLQTLK